MTTRDILAEIVSAYANDTVPITESTRLKEDIGLDSLDYFDLAVDVEDEFCILIEDEDILKVHTFGELLALVLETEE